MLGIPGGWEWIIVLVIALLIFGKRLPGTMRSIGKGVVEFKKGLKGVKDEVDEVEGDIKKIDDKDVNVK
ncbi:MAG: twin-arginine translocase TatA/TatE family subunit [Candidatus Scalindua sp.]